MLLIMLILCVLEHLCVTQILGGHRLALHPPPFQMGTCLQPEEPGEVGAAPEFPSL